MTYSYCLVSTLLLMALSFSCQPYRTGEDADRNSASVDDIEAIENSFSYDYEFLSQYHDDLLTLRAPDGPGKSLVVPAYQGRVMTSSIEGRDQLSFGWINYELIQSQEVLPHMNPYGGEDRFWLGPEGGRYALFFAPGSDQTFEEWQTPAAIDTQPFKMIRSDEHSASFSQDIKLTNYAGFTFQMRVERKVSMLSRNDTESRLDVTLPDSVEWVAFATDNKITNSGDQPWTAEQGLPSIWILGMFDPSDQTTVVIPYQTELPNNIPIVNSDYFGEVPDERLQADVGLIYFQADGEFRSKIGVPPGRVKPVAGSYDSERQILTLIHFTYDEQNTEYVNSQWDPNAEPYQGDVVNAYNDGALAENGDQLGPFYEIESSSPAAALSPQQSSTHTHTTVHLAGNNKQLNEISTAVLGVSLSEIDAAL